jgi:hypothetical protein
MTSALTPEVLDALDQLPASLRDNIQIIDSHALWVGRFARANGGKNIYGRVAVEDGRQSYAHREVFRLLNGDQPGGLRQSCDVPLCVAHWVRPRANWPNGRRPHGMDSDARFLRKIQSMVEAHLATKGASPAA